MKTLESLDIFNTKNIEEIPEYTNNLTIRDYNSLKRATFDIETDGIDPNSSNILLIGLLDINKNEYKYFTNEAGEKEMLLAFNNYLYDNKYDILSGHNVFDFDIPFLINKAKLHNIQWFYFYQGKYETMVSGTSLFGKPISIIPAYCRRYTSIVDTYLLVAILDNVIRSLSSYSLKQSVLELGLRKEMRTELKPNEIIEFWQTNKDKVIEYLKYDLEDTALLLDYLFPSYYYQKEYLSNLSYQDLYLFSTAKKWNYLISKHYKRKPYPDKKVKYEGGLVIVNPGIYLKPAKIDISSLYPHIMLNYRICSRKDKQQMALSILKHITNERIRLKQKAKSGDFQAKLRQGSLKILINSLYGFYGTGGYEFNDMKAAELVCAYGREILKFMLKTIEENRGIVIEADTDGIIFKHDDPKALFNIVQNSLPKGFSIDLEWQAKAIYVPNKKNYVVIFEDGTIDRKGTKFRGREKTWIEKDFPIEYLTLLINNRKEANNFYNRIYTAIKNETIDKSKITATRAIRKNEVSLAHLGKPGEKVSFYIAEKEGPRGGITYYKTLTDPYSIRYYANQLEEIKTEIDMMFEKCNKQILSTIQR